MPQPAATQPIPNIENKPETATGSKPVSNTETKPVEKPKTKENYWEKRPSPASAGKVAGRLGAIGLVIGAALEIPGFIKDAKEWWEGDKSGGWDEAKNKVEPMPTGNDRQSYNRRKDWMEKYGKTYNPDGTLKTNLIPQAMSNNLTNELTREEYTNRELDNKDMSGSDNPILASSTTVNQSDKSIPAANPRHHYQLDADVYAQ